MAWSDRRVCGRPAQEEPDDYQSSTILTYSIAPPSGLSLVEVRGFVGIETSRPTSDGLQPGRRHPDNHVEFELTIDHQVRFKRRKDTSQGERFSILFVIRGDDLSIRFGTNNLGENAYNWAVWGEAELIEVLPLA
jgi:hypothetical protein